MKKGLKFVSNYWQESTLVFLIIIAGILRFTNITKLQFFTYDQARDALFVKRMIVDRQFRLLGTQTSLPGMYLPPFYYYTIAPILWLFKLNPVGIDIYSATIGVLTVPAIFFVANKIFGKPAGVFSAGLMAVSPLVVELTRRAWNPNTLPFFILLAFYFFYKYFKEKKTKDFILGFVFYGYCLSLHFGAWTMIPLVVLAWFHYFVSHKENKFLGLFGGFGILIFFVLPLLLFELRHNFFLTSQAKIFFFDGRNIGVASGNFLEQFITSILALFTILISGKILVGYGAPFEFAGRLAEFFHLSWPISVVAQKPFSLSFQWWGTATFFLILGISLYFLFRKREKSLKLALILIWIWIIWGVFASRLYSGKFFFFYYLFLFPVPILLFGFLFQRAWMKKFLKIPVMIVFILMITFHLKYTTVFEPGWRDIDDLKRVAKIIASNVENNSTFNLATIQKEEDRWDRNAVDYRYFVESFFKKKALDWYPQDYQKAEFLFVVDETGKGDVLKSNIMEIQEFNPDRIMGKWSAGKSIIIYKLSRKTNDNWN